MKAIILAAGRGERMRPLTDTLPKPLLPAGGKPLIVHHIERLVHAGITELIINTAWLGEKIEATLGDGSRWGATIRYSHEEHALETAGGIARALPLLGDAPFLVVNGDVYIEWDFRRALAIRDTLLERNLDFWLMLVPNPPHNPKGDFAVNSAGVLQRAGADALTYAGIGVYHPRFFRAVASDAPARLAPLLAAGIDAGRGLGERFGGEWRDIGTAERLAHLDAYLLPGENVKRSML